MTPKAGVWRAVFRRGFAVSKWVHRYVGLVVLLYLILVGVTDVLLNHPEMLREMSVPRWLVPPAYRIENWKRGALRTLVFSQRDESLGFLAGTEGVWKTSDGGVTFAPLSSGFPTSRADRRTNDLHLMEGEDRDWLLAGTRGGLYACCLADEHWEPVSVGDRRPNVRKVLRIDDRLVAFTDSAAFESAWTGCISTLEFSPAALTREENSEPAGLSLVSLMFALHSGAIWGLPGRLLMDVVGIGLVFLSVSALYVWYFPRSRRWFPRVGRRQASGEAAKRRTYRWLYKYHVDIGLWTALPLIIIGGTALLMPPSPLVFLAIRTTVPREYWPGPLPENPWHRNIRAVAYAPESGDLLIESRGTLWRGAADFREPFTKHPARLPVGPMGPNVMEIHRHGRLLLGSFGGLYECSLDGGPVIDMRTGQPLSPGPMRRMSGGWRVTGYFETPHQERFVATHDGQLIGLDDAQSDDRFRMPPEIASEYRMPLWNYLFELHNGRILGDWLGSSYYLISLLGGISLIVVSLTGVYDWAYRKSTRRKHPRRSSAASEPGLTDDAGTQPRESIGVACRDALSRGGFLSQDPTAICLDDEPCTKG